MTNNIVDRTQELEERLRILYVSSEDTCIFWSKRKNTQIGIKRCFFCEHYCPSKYDGKTGSCGFKRSPPTEVDKPDSTVERG